jgi:glucan phosphoethanolaminetransferase (alkaline phosphatase superfamily)
MSCRLPSLQSVDRGWALSIKVLLLVVFLVATNHGAWERLQSLASPPKAAAFVALWALSAAALFCIAFLPYRSWRYAWTAVLVLGSQLGLGYWLVTKTHLRLADAEQLLDVVAFSDNLLGFYSGPLLGAALVSAIGVVALNMRPFWHARDLRHALPLAAALLVPLVPVSATAGMLYTRGGEGTDGLPVQVTSPAFVLVLALERLVAGPQRERKDVEIAPSAERGARIVIVIMDESVRGDYLDINRPGGVYSGLLPHQASMANFGVMSSISGCSSSTNASFRYGVGRQSYLDDLKTKPSIWRYAKKAGYRTVYLDGQRHNGRLMNLMTAEELADIDEHIQLDPATPPVGRDMEIARRLRRIVEDAREPAFVYVNKMGAHFPYEGKYPREHAVYQPTLKQTYFGNEVDPKDTWSPETEDEDTRTRFRNSYHNTLRWNVGRFFDTLLPGLDLSQAVMLYMADHGQDFHEDGRPGFRTHCTSDKAAPGEGMVPMAVITQVSGILADMRGAAEKNRDRVSQFNVFPSVLALLGYRPGDIARFASSELPLQADLPRGQQQFLSRFFVRLGMQPIWNSIAPAVETALTDTTIDTSGR